MKTQTAEKAIRSDAKGQGSAPGLAFPAAESDEIALTTEIIERIANGATLDKATGETEHSVSWFYSRLVKFDFLQVLYARAKEIRADVFADAIIDIVDDDTIDPQMARNRADARKWHASKMNPSRFGDRIELNINKKPDLAGALLEGKRRVQERIASAQVVDYIDVTTD